MTQSNRAHHLRQLLQAHAPASPEEQRHLAEMLALLEDSPGPPGAGDPFSRHRYVPGHFTASAFVLSPSGTDLLLIYHQKLGRWLQPGGHIESSDSSVLYAATREAREETGLTAIEPVSEQLFDVDVHQIPESPGGPAHRHFDVRLLFQAKTLDCIMGDGVLDVRWVPLTQLTAELSDESVLRGVKKLLSAGPKTVSSGPPSDERR